MTSKAAAPPAEAPASSSAPAATSPAPASTAPNPSAADQLLHGERPQPARAATEATDGCTSACDGVTGIRGLLEHVGIDTTGRNITVAGRIVDAAPAHNAGPSVRECTANDRRWPLEKHGE